MSTVEEHPYPPTESEPTDHVGRRYERWRSWRWALLGALVAVQLAGVLTSPIRADPDDFFADLSAGHVHALRQGQYEWHPQVGYQWQPRDISDSDDTSPAGVRWVGRYGAVYQTDLSLGPSGRSNGIISPGQVDVAATAAAMAQQTGHQVPDVASSLYQPGAPVLPLAAAVVMLVIVWLLVAGPQPRRFTKWGWFWIIALIPAGIGGVWYLLREAPWSTRMSAEPSLAPRQTRPTGDPSGPPRRGGWLGLVLAALLALPVAAVLQAGLYGVADHHGQPPATWRMVDHSGRTVIGHTDRR